MRKIIVLEFVTLDGVMQGPGEPDEFAGSGWQRPYICEEQLTHIVAQAYDAEALLLGRKTYEGFAAAWPSVTGLNGLADRMNAMQKFVVSRTFKRVEWNTTLLSGDAVQEVKRLKQEPGGDLLVLGSGELVQTLMKHRLIDEYRIWVHPVVLGCGVRLFREGGTPIKLSLVDTKTISSGAVILTYRPAE